MSKYASVKAARAQILPLAGENFSVSPSYHEIGVAMHTRKNHSECFRVEKCKYISAVKLRKYFFFSFLSRVSEIEEAIRKGISDADPEARAGMRR